MLISETIIMKWNSKNKKWFELKKYKFTKMKDEFEVRVEDLSECAKTLVLVQCDECGRTLPKMSWVGYKKSVHEDDRYYCQKCANNGNIKYISFKKWCYDNLSNKEAKGILSRWDYNLNIDKQGNNFKPDDVTFGSKGFNNKGYWFKCLEHPEHGSELKNINSYTHGHGSVKCIQCHMITTTNPELVNYFVDKEDALKHSIGSRSSY